MQNRALNISAWHVHVKDCTRMLKSVYCRLLTINLQLLDIMPRSKQRLSQDQLTEIERGRIIDTFDMCEGGHHEIALQCLILQQLCVYGKDGTKRIGVKSNSCPTDMLI